MNTARVLTLQRSLLASLVAAVTIWACLLTWRPLTERPGGYVAPLLVGGITIAVIGGHARWRGINLIGVLGLQLLVAVPLLLMWTTGSPLPSASVLADFARALSQGSESANRFAAPVPTDVPSVAPLFLTIGLGAILLVDLLALSARKVASTGLVLLVLHLIPVNLGIAVPWWIFGAVSAGFLTLLFLDQNDHVLVWGEDIDEQPDSTSTPRATGGSGTTALKIGALAGAGALALSSVLSTLAPHSPLRLWPGGSQGDSGQLTLASPLVDLRRDLVRGRDLPLLSVTGAKKPTYVRTAVLADFNGAEWSTGDRRATRVQAASGIQLALPGVDALVERSETTYVFRATDAFRSSWLPTMSTTSSVQAEGDWRYDQDTMDFASFDPELSAASMSWDVVGVDLSYSAVALDRAPSAVSQVDESFTELPGSLPASIEATTREVVGDELTRFRQARALQDWFRSEFTYSLEQGEPVGSNELVAFLDESGRVGYCEQFAASMAVMARTLGIPSRVAVGFLSPERVGSGEWEFSSHDLHAWPELYFAGSGWIRFEPTPAARASGVPNYTEDAVEPSAAPSPVPSPTDTATPSPPAAAPDETAPAPEQTAAAEDTTETSAAWGRLVSTLAGMAILALLALTPQWIRGRRRTRRFTSGQAEELWAELRDSSIDLGFDWPTGRSPRGLAAQVSQWSALDGSGVGAERRDSGSQLMLLVEAVEQERFAHPDLPRRSDAGAWAEATNRQVAGMQANASRAQRWRARWIPRSLATKR